MLEKMSEFFENRLDGYDEHMLTCIESAEEFYPFTADLLPKEAGCRVLDLGCGTGLELEYYFRLNPSALVTGVDLSQGMLDELRDNGMLAVMNQMENGRFEDVMENFAMGEYDDLVQKIVDGELGDLGALGDLLTSMVGGDVSGFPDDLVQ